MKSYLQGIITGIAIVFFMFIFMGQTDSEKRQLERKKNEKKLKEKIMQLKSVHPENELLRNIHKRFDELNRKIDDNNGILNDIYTDGIPCNN
tara:strand:- start:510 stop:785 length:276 start_codon:yes stop_codon:yes gene_type:complete